MGSVPSLASAQGHQACVPVVWKQHSYQRERQEPEVPALNVLHSLIYLGFSAASMNVHTIIQHLLEKTLDTLKILYSTSF